VSPAHSTASLDTGSSEVLAEQRGGVLVLTLNRPEARNALSDTLTPALRRMVAVAGERDDVRALLVTGAGSAFCAGGDVKGMGTPSSSARTTPRSFEEAVEQLRVREETLTGALYELPKPTLAALPGPAAGAGLSLALACDLRIAAESAFVTTGFANVGLAGDYGSSFFLTRLVGSAKARELFFSAERVSAAECERLGIVNRVVPDAELRPEALAWAERLAAGPTATFALMKRNLDLALHADLHAVLAQEAENTVRSAQTRDHKEAVQAFVQKRRPKFEGR
jgi:enoyl-CoA hydratase/carnithine racemase